ncbi:hypothetical protein QBC47DRAFT_417240 [Echria macrotheca]|uniref:Uncharacterized protein n=1 Tax=Echria macrotheca TaxID=438768 RepID=A0AAJ0F5F5_9PEZI|nr:hypothetical protein QBC47DRAFT_417240 [Echria macrotheca]
MSSQTPTGPSQPPTSEAYTTSRNPVERKPSEQAVADTPGPSASGGDDIEHRNQADSASRGSAVPSALGRGIHGTDPSDYKSSGQKDAGPQNENEDAEQMAVPSEGKVADAVERKSGTQQQHGRGRGEVDLQGTEADMERKKAQQSFAREEVKEARREGKDVDGGAGASGRQPRAEID